MGTARVQIMDRLSLLDQFALVSVSNLLLGAHGAGLAWLVAMPLGSAVLEAMPLHLPRHVLCVDSWNHPRNLRDTIYGGLAHLSGQHHICLTGNGSAADRTRSQLVINFRDHIIDLPIAKSLWRIREATRFIA